MNFEAAAAAPTHDMETGNEVVSDGLAHTDQNGNFKDRLEEFQDIGERFSPSMDTRNGAGQQNTQLWNSNMPIVDEVPSQAGIGSSHSGVEPAC